MAVIVSCKDTDAINRSGGCSAEESYWLVGRIKRQLGDCTRGFWRRTFHHGLGFAGGHFHIRNCVKCAVDK